MEELIRHLGDYVAHYGYWTVAAALLLENAGLPVPGETVLIAASVMANSRHTLDLPTIIAVGTVAATVGDNIGYAVGRWGGRPLLERYRRLFRITPQTLARGERVFRRYGALTIFFARFVFGLRVVAGPLGGALRMPWPRFVLFNLLGAATWVTVVASLAYVFASELPVLSHALDTASLVLLAALVLILVVFGKRMLMRLAEEEA